MKGKAAALKFDNPKAKKPLTVKAAAKPSLPKKAK